MQRNVSDGWFTKFEADIGPPGRRRPFSNRSTMDRSSIAPSSKFNLNGLDFCSSYVLIENMSDRPASWRMPTPEQMEKLAAKPDRHPKPAGPTPGPGDDLPDAYWDSIVRDPRGRVRSGVPIQNRRLSEIPRHVLRVSCRRCDRIVEIQTVDAMRLYGAHAIWKDVGMKLLDNGCQERTGRHEEDGCWPSFERT
jgi:hypothetical protein